MAVDCPDGFELATPLPSKPPDTNTHDAESQTYTRATYEWVLADTSAFACACGQQCTFTFSYSTTSEGQITVTLGGSGGSVTGGEVITSELSVTVGPNDFEYRAFKVILRETKEAGTFTTSYQGLFGFIKFAITFFTGQLPLPTITYSPTTKEVKDLLAAIQVCRRPCR